MTSAKIKEPMSQIFDRFPSREKAEAFVRLVKRDFGLDGQVFDDEEKAFEHDMFPFRLDPPIVHIDRVDIDRDDCLAVEKRSQSWCRSFLVRSRELDYKLSKLSGVVFLAGFAGN
jgi:hypothetical protein